MPPVLLAAVTHRLDQRRGALVDPALLGMSETGQCDQFLDDLCFVDPMIFAQTLAELRGMVVAHRTFQFDSASTPGVARV